MNFIKSPLDKIFLSGTEQFCQIGSELWYSVIVLEMMYLPELNGQKSLLQQPTLIGILWTKASNNVVILKILKTNSDPIYFLITSNF